MTNQISIPGSKVGRARRVPSQLWQVPTFIVGLLAFIGAGISAPWRPTPQSREFDEIVTALRHGLTHEESGDALVSYAENLKLRLPRFPGRAAEANFLIGSAYYRQAQQKPAASAKAIWPRAVEHFQEALASGGLDADRSALQYRLGYSLFQQKKEIVRALELMTLGMEKGAEQPLQGYRLLIQAHLDGTPPDVEAALAASRRVLDLSPERDVEAMGQARLQHGELLMKKEHRADALKEFERIGSKASRQVRVKARLLQARCFDEDAQWSKAIPIWQELLRDAALVDGGRARILYSLGRCYQQADPPNHTETMRAWTDALKEGGQDGQAAGLELGRLRLALGGADASEALADWKSALRDVNAPEDYTNPHIDLGKLQRWFDDALRKFQDAQDAERTQAVAELYRKIAPPGAAEMLIGEAAESRARQLADLRKVAGSKVSLADVQTQYLHAGRAFELAAPARPEADRPDALWRSIQCYLAAGAAKRAQEILYDFVKVEVKEVRLAEAWYTLGDLYRAAQNRVYAHMAYVKCIEIGANTRFAYRSRFHLAVEEHEKGRLEQARDILRQILEWSSPDIERAWQEKAIFKMGALLIDMKDFDEARVHIIEGLRLYRESPSALHARLQLGECYRELAKKHQLEEAKLDEMIKPGLADERLQRIKDDKSQCHKMRFEKVHEAIKTYQQLADEIEMQSRRQNLTDHESAVLRRARLGIGECELDNGSYSVALEVFQSLQLKHRRTLEGFYACKFVCYAFHKLEQTAPTKQTDMVRESAKASVRDLTEDLRALPNEQRPPDYGQWLVWAETELRDLSAPPKKDAGRQPFP